MNLDDLQGTFKFTEDFSDLSKFKSEPTTPRYESIAVTRDQKREQYECFLSTLPRNLVSIQEVQNESAVLDKLFEKHRARDVGTQEPLLKPS